MASDEPPLEEFVRRFERMDSDREMKVTIRQDPASDVVFIKLKRPGGCAAIWKNVAMHMRNRLEGQQIVIMDQEKQRPGPYLQLHIREPDEHHFKTVSTHQFRREQFAI